MIEQRVKCSFGEYQVPAVVHAVQGDTARVLVFEPDDYTLTGAETASLFCVRPNGTAYSYAGTVSSTYNTITVDLDDDGGALTQAGVVAAQLVLSISGEEGKSFKLGIIVEECLGGTATADDQTFLTSLQAQLNAALSDYTVNGQAFGDSTILKSAQFSEAITGEKMLANIKYTGTTSIAMDGKTWSLAALGITYEDVSISTGSTEFQSMYYGDTTPTNAKRDKTVAMFVYNVTNSRPAYITWVDNTTLRGYTTAASSSLTARVYYLS